MVNNVIMPKQGLQMTEGVIIKWYYSEGETVKSGTPLFSMETDKLTIDIDSQFDGVLLKIIAEEGETVPITETIAFIGDAGDEIPAIEKKQSATAPVAETPAPAVVEAPKPVESLAALTKAPQITPSDRLFITPRAKLRAIERGVDYEKAFRKGKLQGSGNGIIVERDIISYVPENASYSAVSMLESYADASAALAYLSSLTKGGIECDIFTFVAYTFAKAGELSVSYAKNNDDESYEFLAACEANSLASFASKLKDINSVESASSFAVADFTDKRISKASLPLTEELDAILCVAKYRDDVVFTLSFDSEKLPASKAADILDRMAFMLENPTLMLSM